MSPVSDPIRFLEIPFALPYSSLLIIPLNPDISPVNNGDIDPSKSSDIVPVNPDDISPVNPDISPVNSLDRSLISPVKLVTSKNISLCILVP